MAASLEYAPIGPPRRQWIARAVAMSAGLAVAVAGWRYGPAAWRQGWVLYWQHRCMTYAAPAEQVVYDEGPTATGRVAAGAAVWYAASPRPAGLAVQAMASARRPPPPAAAVASADCWRQFGTLAPAWPWPDGAALFCHELRSVAGVRRLVIVQHVPTGNVERFVPGLDVQVTVYQPATLLRPPLTSAVAVNYSGMVPYSRRPQALIIYAGQADPADPAHFTVRYQMWGQTDTLDGRLTDGGFVRLTPRHRPPPPQ